MQTNTPLQYLTYARVQMAAEALLERFPSGTGQGLTDALRSGNNRSSRFTSADASAFANEWEVIAYQPNTTTGFSGTVFKYAGTTDPARGLVKGQLVMSFRSTEFVDDAARDNEATNRLEVAAGGWAMGQIADMEAWYRSLTVAGGVLDGKRVTVTGYSLGGHLATAFNLLHQGQGRIDATYTFNGAGVGIVKGAGDDNGLTGAMLRAIVNTFDRQRKNLSGNEIALGNAQANSLFAQLRTKYTGGIDPTDADIQRASTIFNSSADAALLLAALRNVRDIVRENVRVAGLSSGGASPSPSTPAGASIEATRLDYQVALLLAQRKTAAIGLATNAANTLTDFRNTARNPLSNFHDLYGATYPSAVSNSQIHYGASTGILIEDQPLYRGGVIESAAKASFDAWGVKLLVPGFEKKDFGDTHSLVLIVDSLAVQSALAKLQPDADQGTVGQILSASSNARSESGSDQGRAEGDTLERVIDALGRLLVSPTWAPIDASAQLIGGTWANFDYRDKVFYPRLQEVTAPGGAFEALAGRVLVNASSSDLKAYARNDFSALASLLTLSPLTLKGLDTTLDAQLRGKWGGTYTAWERDRSMPGTERAGGAETFTDRWIDDRAALLGWLLRRNALNVPEGTALFDPRAARDFVFSDLPSGLRLQISSRNTPPSAEQIPDVAFGSEGGDLLTGRGADDHLYGGGGNDNLKGLGGDDHLEGNAGADTLEGGNGNDTLLGGSGADVLYGQAGQDTLRGGDGADLLDGGTEDDELFGGADADTLAGGAGSDTLDGGAGSDTLDGGDGDDALHAGDGDDKLNGGAGSDQLEGGSGTDEYSFSPGWGHDTVIDGDGRGSIVVVASGAVNGAGSRKVGANAWLSGDRQVSFALLSRGAGHADLSIRFADGNSIVIRDWSPAANLGIVLSDAEDTPTTTNTLTGHATIGALDLITGGAQADLIQGLDGDDAMIALAGDDRIEGGDGNDVLMGGLGRDTLIGGDGGDLIYGSSNGRLPYENDWGEAGSGEVPPQPITLSSGAWWSRGSYGPDAEGFLDDWLNGISRDTQQNDEGNVIDSGAGDDYVLAGTGRDLVHGGPGRDQIWGMAEADVLFGDAADDRIYGDGQGGTENLTTTPGPRTGNDLIDGGEGNDILLGQGGADTVYGGPGRDTLYGDDRTTADTLAEFTGDDYLDGGDGDDYMEGGGRDDTMFGGAGADTLFGDGLTDLVPAALQGKDHLDGEGGSDQLNGGGNDDELFGGDGDDNLWGDGPGADATNQGKDYLDGEGGSDNLIGGGNDDELFGGDGNDHLFGDHVESVLSAPLHGKDYLDGGAGNDELTGFGNDDWLIGGEGDDTMRGDAALAQLGAAAHGADHMEGGSGSDSMQGDGGNDVLFGGEGDDFLAGEDQIQVTDGTMLTGDDVLYGDAGNDTLVGGVGDDRLDGGAGNDHLFGGPGNDTLIATSGRDQLEGGAGDDTFIVGADSTLAVTIVDGDSDGVDTLVLEGSSKSFYNVLRIADALELHRDDGSVAGIIHSFFRGDVVERIAFDGGVVATFDEIRTLSMSGGDLNDTVTGFATDDFLSGGRGNDTLDGGDGDDTLDGGAGNDILMGGRGNNVFLFGAGMGQDTLRVNLLARNVLQFGAGVLPADVGVERQGDAIKLTIKDTDDSALIELGETPNGDAVWSVESIRFADNTTWTVAMLAEGVTAGTPGNDAIVGFNYGHEVLAGGAGDDSIDGGGGWNTYLFGKGDGHDSVGPATASSLRGPQELRFKPGVTANDVVFVRSWDDLIVQILSTGDRIMFWGAFNSPLPAYPDGYGNPLRRVEFADGTVLAGDPANDGNAGTLSGIGVLATSGNDNLIGARGPDAFSALAGDDTVDGVSGDDAIRGGPGQDLVRGGDGSDLLWGDEGDDTLFGGQGTDTLYGGSGNDTLWGSDGGGAYQGGVGQDVLDGGTGDDILRAGKEDNLFLFGRDDGHDKIYGNYYYLYTGPAANNALRFKAGVTPSDVTVVRTTPTSTYDAVGAVFRIKGTSDEVEVVDFFSALSLSRPTAIQRVEFDNGVVWDVATIVSKSLESNALTGTAGNDAITGTAGADVISGLGGNDALNGAAGNDRVDGGPGDDQIIGGAGADLLVGGSGNDTFDVDNEGDVVIEAPSEGLDTVNATISWTLAAHVENLTLTGSAALNAIGNGAANVIVGNGAANRIDGGAGADVMRGGAGNDTYVVDNPSDSAIEAANGGIDTVESTITWGLAAELENLTLTGTAAINATGNAVANTLRGNTAGNVLDGAGGADTMIGGAGDDIYRVDAAADVVVEAAGEGRDRVESSVATTLASNVEDLTLTGGLAINGTGNALDNMLVGNAAANTLWGGAGNDSLNGNAGADSLIGGAGNDTYFVDNAGDSTVEAANEGLDTVNATLTWTLANHLENLTLVGTAAISGSGNALPNVLKGNSASNTLTGNAGNDTLDGDAGADTLIGGSGNDIYVLGRGYGVELVQENDSTAGNTDVLQFLPNVAADQIWFRKVGNDLEVSVIGTQDRATLRSWYLGGSYHVEQFKTSGGRTLLDSRVQSLVNAMAAFAPPGVGQSTLPASYQASLAPIIAASWGP